MIIGLVLHIGRLLVFSWSVFLRVLDGGFRGGSGFSGPYLRGIVEGLFRISKGCRGKGYNGLRNHFIEDAFRKQTLSRLNNYVFSIKISDSMSTFLYVLKLGSPDLHGGQHDTKNLTFQKETFSICSWGHY